MESTLYKSIFEKGEAKGKAEGKAEAYAETLIQILLRRLGTLSPAIGERLHAMSDLELLHAWYEEVLDANDAAAARQVVEKIAATPVPST